MAQPFNEEVFFNNGSQTYGNAFVSGDLTVDGNIRGNVTSNSVNVSGVATITNISTTLLTVGTGVTVGSGIVTATNGFHSGIGTAVKVTTVGNRVFLTVVGVGVTSFQLY